MSIKDIAAGGAGLLGCLVMLGVGLFVLGIGSAGIGHELGFWWGVAAFVAAVVLRFTLPISIGVFFYARDIWHLHWVVALLIASPGLIFMVPGVIAAAWSSIRKR